MNNITRKWYTGMRSHEDWWAVWIGLFILILWLPGLWGIDLVGWVVQIRAWEWTDVWNQPSADKLFDSLSARSETDTVRFSGIASLFMTYLVFTVIFTVAVWLRKQDVKKFLLGFTCLYFLAIACWVIGQEIHFKATLTSQSAARPALYGNNAYCVTRVDICSRQINTALIESGVNIKAGLSPHPEQAVAALDSAPDVRRLAWGLQLGSGFSFIVAFLGGLLIRRLSGRFALFLNEAAKPEWYIKTGVVCLGTTMGIVTMKLVNVSTNLLIAGAAAAFVVSLIIWAGMYTLTRRIFSVQQCDAAILSAGVAGGGIIPVLLTTVAIRGRVFLPVVMSVIITLFAIVELVGMPKFYASLSTQQPVVNGAALGLTIKNDSVDAVAGEVLGEMVVFNQHRSTGKVWDAGVIAVASLVAKFWLEIFISIWAVILALIWSGQREAGLDQAGNHAMDTWLRFPKFLLGFLLVWLLYIVIAGYFPEMLVNTASSITVIDGSIRNMMFMLAFLAVGLNTDLSQAEGLGKLTWLYAIGLLVIVPPIAYLVAYIFHNGMLPVVLMPVQQF